MRPAGQMAVPVECACAVTPRPAIVPDNSEVRAFVHDGAATERLQPEWVALAETASEPNVFAEHWFVAPSLRALGPNVRIIEVRRGARLIGLLPVSVEWRYGRTPVHFVQNWMHDHMFLGTPMVQAGEEEAFWSAALDVLDDADWAPNFLHVRALVADGPVHRGLSAAAAARGRSCAIVHRRIRAMLASRLDPQSYYQDAVRPKKRKEIKRLRNRLGELGPVQARRLDDAAALQSWCDDYLALEKAGWKGRAGTALACTPETERFFRDAVAGAWAAGRLDFLRLDLGDRPLAMLINLLYPPGGFSFKTTFDEDYARFSPGVLIQLENLGILARGDIEWLDSCAMDNHPMIDSLWPARREVVRVTVRLKGARRGAIYAASRALEIGSAALRRLK